jgi:hypothetical protein
MRKVKNVYVADSVSAPTNIHPYIAEAFEQRQPPPTAVPPITPHPMPRCDNLYVKRMPGVNNGHVPAAAMCQSGWIMNPIFKKYRLRVLSSPIPNGGTRLGGTAFQEIVN